MVHSVPTSVTTPLAQQGAQQAASRLELQKSTSEDSTTSEVAYAFSERGRRGGGGEERVRESSSPHPSLQEKDEGVRQEQEESIQTCTKAIASLCIDSEDPAERGGGGGGRGDEGKDGGRGPPSSSSPSVLSPDPQQQQQQQQRSPSISMSPPSPHPSPSPPQGPGIQHFSNLELRPPHASHPASPRSSSSPSCSPHPHSPGSDTLQPPTSSKPLKLERDKEAGTGTNRIKDVS